MISQTEINAVLEVLQTIHAWSDSRIAQSIDKPRSFGSLCRDCGVKVAPTYLKQVLLKHGLLHSVKDRLIWNACKTAPNRKLAEFMIKEARVLQAEAARESPSRQKLIKNAEIVEKVIDNVLDKHSDKELVEELRRRGYTVTATISL